MVTEPDQRRGRGDLAQQILDVLETAGWALTPAQVLSEFGGDLAYTTVMTVLARMHAKGLTTRDLVGRSYAYTAVIDDAEVTAHQIHRLLDARSDRAAVLTSFASGLSPEESRLLVDLLGTEPEADRS